MQLEGIENLFLFIIYEEAYFQNIYCLEEHSQFFC